MISIKIGNSRYPLRFTLAAMDGIEETTGKTIGELNLRVKSKADRAELIAVLAVFALLMILSTSIVASVGR